MPVVDGSATTGTATTDPATTIEPPTKNTGTQAGVLTAGVWDDNLNYDFFEKYLDSANEEDLAGAPSFTTQQRDDAQALALKPRTAKSLLDVALVIDTTGSMSDELSYLQTEFSALSKTIADKYPNAEQRWSLLLYRDEGDEYVTRGFNFLTDLGKYQQNLLEQSASGGGDAPEAVDQALAATTQFAWRTTSDTAKLLFWVADAPHHDEKANAFTDAILNLAALDVHIYPVASSGVDDLAQVSMRSAAQLTLGRYLFLTDDSGVGNAHTTPDIPCYYVTGLDDAVLRMVDFELTGKQPAIDSTDIIRAVGSPNEQGQCEIAESQMTAHAL
jgi:hypothetical protein